MEEGAEGLKQLAPPDPPQQLPPGPAIGMAMGAKGPPAPPAAIGTVRVRADMVSGFPLALAATGGGDPWRWRSRGSDQGGRRCLLTRDTMGRMGETGKRLWLARAWAPWQDGLRWSLRGCRARAGPGNRQHEKYPEESQDDHQGEKLGWNHGVPPAHGVIQGAFYPVFGGSELAADWRYTTLRFRRGEQPQRRRSGATVLIVKGAFVYFFSSGPPGVARASDALAWR